MGEYKSVSGFGGTKRRRDANDTAYAYGGNALSRRVTRLAKSLKGANPTHVMPYNGATYFPSISTTGTQLALGDQIMQGDDYTQRFGNHADITHINVKLVLAPGTTAATTSAVRCTLFVAAQNVVFASTMNSTYSPISAGGVTRLLRDRFYQVAGADATAGYSTMINWSVKVRFRQKYTGAGVSTQTGDTLFLLIQSEKAAGTTAPVIRSGLIEVFFKP